MLEHEQAIAGVREVILKRWPYRFAEEALRADVSIGEEGLGLDSVEVVEVVLACEERWDLTATEELFEILPLTIDRLAAYFAAQSGVNGPEAVSNRARSSE